MKAIVIAGLCEVMIIWKRATYIPFGICQPRVVSGGAGAGSLVCLGFAVKFFDSFIMTMMQKMKLEIINKLNF